MSELMLPQVINSAGNCSVLITCFLSRLCGGEEITIDKVINHDFSKPPMWR